MQPKEGRLAEKNDLQICTQGVHSNANTGLLSFSLKTLRTAAVGETGRGFGDN